MPISVVENEHFLKFISTLRPTFKVPSRYKIANSLLDYEYNLVKQITLKKIEKASCITVTSDGWTDVNGVGLINIIACTPEPIFYKAIDTECERHTGNEFGFL